MIYYVFKPTTGRARMVTDDKIGAKLPKRRTGEWILDKDLEIIPGGDTSIGASADDVIADIQRDGYYLWLEPELAPPTSRLTQARYSLIDLEDDDSSDADG